MPLSRSISIVFAILGLLIVSGRAGQENPAPTKAKAPEEAPSTFDRIWSYGTLYENPENPVIQRLRFTGRAQADAAFFDSDHGDYQRLDWRRFRAGLKASLLDDFTLHSEVELDLNEVDVGAFDDAYARFTDFYLGWSQDDAFTIKAGKQSAPFTLDGATSSKNLIALERSTVATNLWFPEEYFTGIAALGESDGLSYHLGVYSASADPEFGSFDSGYFGLASLGYDFASSTGLDASLVRLDYVYSDPDYSGEVGTRDLRHVISLVGKLEQGAAGLWSELSFGDGHRDQSDLFGLQLTPYYNLSDQLQAVFRYSYVTGSDDRGVRLNRYENRISSDRYDDAHEFFLGLNWYLYGHKLKWQNGVEYTTASTAENDGYNGWGLTSGIRLNW